MDEIVRVYIFEGLTETVDTVFDILNAGVAEIVEFQKIFLSRQSLNQN